MRKSLKFDTTAEKEKRGTLEEIVRIGRGNRQLGVYLFIYYWYMQYREGIDFKRLWRFYNNIAGHVVHENTVRKQLESLKNKGLIEIKNNKVYPRVYDHDAITDLFDYKRSRAGKRGALKRLKRALKLRLHLELEELEIPRNLDYYVRKILGIATELVKKGRRWEALDLAAHSLLPIRETGILWLWRNDEFIYYEPKAKPSVHSVRFPALAKALKKLGFKEGVMIDHVKGHNYIKNVIHKLFGKGTLSWVWSRSIFYGLKKFGLAKEGSNYIMELERKDSLITLWLKDYYGNIIATYEKQWLGKAPEPLTNRTYYKTIVVGKQHVYEPNEENYFSKW